MKVRCNASCASLGPRESSWPSCFVPLQAVFSMLEDMDFMRKFKIPKDQLARFVLTNQDFWTAQVMKARNKTTHVFGYIHPKRAEHWFAIHFSCVGYFWNAGSCWWFGKATEIPRITTGRTPSPLLTFATYCTRTQAYLNLLSKCRPKVIHLWNKREGDVYLHEKRYEQVWRVSEEKQEKKMHYFTCK